MGGAGDGEGVPEERQMRSVFRAHISGNGTLMFVDDSMLYIVVYLKVGR